MREGDRLRSSWSEDVWIGHGAKVYVSTAIETTTATASMDRELERLTALVAAAHMANIKAARGEGAE